MLSEKGDLVKQRTNGNNTALSLHCDNISRDETHKSEGVALKQGQEDRDTVRCERNKNRVRVT